MINFACKKFDINEILRCSLGLTKTEYVIFNFIKENPEYLSSRTIAEKLDLDLTTAQRAMKKFFSLKVVSRMQENLENGGYIFRYRIKNSILNLKILSRIKPQSEIQSIISNIIDNWTKNIKSEINTWK